MTTLYEYTDHAGETKTTENYAEANNAAYVAGNFVKVFEDNGSGIAYLADIREPYKLMSEGLIDGGHHNRYIDQSNRPGHDKV